MDQLELLDSEEVHLRGKNSTTDRKPKKGIRMASRDRRGQAARDDEAVPEIDLREEEGEAPRIRFKKSAGRRSERTSRTGGICVLSPICSPTKRNPS
jgi:hypothetical protein